MPMSDPQTIPQIHIIMSLKQVGSFHPKLPLFRNHWLRFRLQGDTGKKPVIEHRVVVQKSMIPGVGDSIILEHPTFVTPIVRILLINRITRDQRVGERVGETISLVG